MTSSGTPALFAVLLATAAVPSGAAPSPLTFVDVAATVGVDRPTWCGRLEKPHILESNGTGLGWVDYDRDGDLDLYVVNGWRLEGTEVVERGRDTLYRNDGDRFVDVTEPAGLDSDAWGSGLAVGDVNSDGEPDLFVTNFGPDVLYVNQGDGSFATGSSQPGVPGWSAGAAFFDADGDGDEDLFVGAYIDATLDDVLYAEPTLDWEGRKVMLGPFGLEGEANRFFRNVDGCGEMVDATAESGLRDKGLFYTFGVSALDLDGDLDLDLYAANDSNPNYVYENQGDGTFRDVGLWSGAAFDRMGAAQAGMGLASGDLQSDGLPDLLVTNFQKDVCTLYENLGGLMFEDITFSTGLDGPTFAMLSWGTALADLDHDTDLDVVIVNGHIYPQADEVPEISGGFAQPNLLLLNDDGRFRDATASAGSGFEIRAVSHGLAVGDADGDGDLDLAVSNIDEPPNLLENEAGAEGSWVIVDAPSALRVEIDAGDRRLVRHRVAGGSFLSVDDSRHHVGLGSASTMDRMRLVAPGGRDRVFAGLPVDRVIVVRETLQSVCSEG